MPPQSGYRAYKHLEIYHLRIILEDDNALLYQLMPPDGTEAESVRLAFLDGGCPTIVIYGDLCPGVSGVVSATGYGIGWFTQAGGDDYLLSKFLTRDLQWDAVVACIDERMEDKTRDGEDASEWKALRERVIYGEFSHDGQDTQLLYQAVLDIDSDAYDSCTDYDERDRDLILRVRSVFRRLYTELEQKRELEQKMGESRKLIAASVDKGEDSSESEAAKAPPWWKRALTWLLAPRPGYGGKLGGNKPGGPLPTPPRTMEPPKPQHRSKS